LELKVYAKRSVGSDNYFGEMNEDIELLLAQGATGGPSNLTPFVQEPISPLIACTRALRRRGSNGVLQPLECVIGFNIVSIEPSSAAIANQSSEAVESSGLRATPESSSALHVPGADDVLGPAVVQYTSIADAWRPLLSKIERFTKIVDGIAEVSDAGYSLHIIW
jgi:hypothetical protein